MNKTVGSFKLSGFQIVCMSLCISCSSGSALPTGVAASDPARVGYHLQSHTDVVLDEVLVNIKVASSDLDISQLSERIGGKVVGYIPGLQFVQIQFPNNTNDSSKLDLALDTLSTEGAVDAVYTNMVYQTAGITNDYEWGTQTDPSEAAWGQRAINLPAAWDVTTGVRGGRPIGVVDVGFFAKHEDFEDRASMRYGKDGSAPTTNAINHGTIVAGIAGATGNNKQGIAGVNWLNPIYLYSVWGELDILHSTDSTPVAAPIVTDATLRNALSRAIDDKLPVINLSVHNEICMNNNCSSPMMDSTNALQYLEQQKKNWTHLVSKLRANDVLLVIAAGNRYNVDAKWNGGLQALACDEPSDSGNFLWVASVGDPTALIKKQDGQEILSNTQPYSSWKQRWYQLSGFSSYCATGHGGVAAPGADILSLVSSNLLQPNTTDKSWGSSMAAPFVSGLASLMREKWPKLSAGEVKKKIITSASAGQQVFGNQRIGKDGQTLPFFVVDAAAALKNDTLPPQKACASGCANCNTVTGICLACRVGYAGIDCNQCATGYSGANCQPVAGSSCAGPIPSVQWLSRAPLDSTELPIAAASLGTQIHLLGGNNVFRHRLYDTNVNIWVDLKPIPQSVGGNIAVVGSSIYGFGNNVTANNVMRWENASDSWTTLSLTPYLLNLPATGVINNKVYFAGGYGGGPTADKATIYDPATNGWTSLASIPTWAGSLASAVVGSRFFLFGGEPDPKLIRVYDPATNTWSSPGSMPLARWQARALTINSQAWVMGGVDPTNADSYHYTIDRYDPGANTWCAGPNLPAPLANFSVQMVNGKIYIMGGQTTSGVPVNTVWEGTIL